MSAGPLTLPPAGVSGARSVCQETDRVAPTAPLLERRGMFKLFYRQARECTMRVSSQASSCHAHN